MEEVRRFLKEDFRWAMDRSRLVAPFQKDKEKLNDLVQIVVDQEAYPISEYASYALTHLQRQNTDLSPYRKKFIDLLFVTDNQSVLRNLTNILYQQEVTEYRESELIDLLISFVQDPGNKVALHVYSIYNLINFVRKYPELRSEILEIIDLNLEGKTAAYQIARRNFIQKSS